MERGSMDKLKFDRRLVRRRGWVDSGELDSHLASLPDVESKRRTSNDDPREQTESAASSESRHAQTAPAAPEPLATPNPENPNPAGES